MTISEAKKIIEMCTDYAVKKIDGEETKIYVNKEYVLQILDMVVDSHENASPSQIGIGTGEHPSITRDLLPNDYYPYGWPKVYYGNKPEHPTDVYGGPVTYCNGSTPGNPNSVLLSTPSDSKLTHRFTADPIKETAEGAHTT